MPLFLFDTNDGYDCVSDAIGVTLADRASAEKVAASCLAGIAKDLFAGVQEVSVVVKSSNGNPVFRATLTLSCVSLAEASLDQQTTVPNKAKAVLRKPDMIN